jgi:hypothetical protein
MLSKALPKVYGDKIEHSGSLNITLPAGSDKV